MPRPSLLDHFSGLDDPRQRGKVLYPLPEIMLLILCATLSGAEDFVETRLWGLKKLRFLRGILPFKRGIPLHDTLNDGMNALDGDLFAAAFTAWVDGLRDTEPDIAHCLARIIPEYRVVASLERVALNRFHILRL